MLGIGSYTYPWSIGVPGHEPEARMDSHELIDKAVELGVGLVQVCENLPLDALPEAELAVLERRAESNKVQVQVGTRGIASENLIRHLDIAMRFKSRVLRVVVDTATEHPTPEEVAQQLQLHLPRFVENDITLAIENHDRFTCDSLLWILDKLGSTHVGICLDTVNSFGALEGPGVVIQKLMPHTVNLHLKDFTIKRHSHQMGFTIEGTPAGQGQLNIPALLGQIPSDCDAILELWTPPATTIEETVSREQEWARESIAYLKSQFNGRTEA